MENQIAAYFKKAAAEILGTFENVSDIRLEEYSKYRKEIVVSFLVPKPLKSLQPPLSAPVERVYKVIEFDAHDNVSNVKIYH